ncbi:hypothetical protein I4F81_006329 [Pyropia yezoensis]|uniref:Uncharacterized protein n=1 Tax=Pyropia yezoensis TaxID=2788 RepID=A0ACC3C0Q0_PYRYE|nr:hypothetical protein I4F81_006329 [Neopyropia yezoensis]
MALMTASPVAWTPDPGGLRQVVVMLRDSACGSTAVQAQVYERLRSLAQHAEFNNYLAYILARGPADGRSASAPTAASASAEPRDAEAVGVRQAAGLLLKNNLKRLYNSLQPPVQTYINGELLSAIGDDSKLIRSAVAVCITAIVSEAGLQVWPELLPSLMRCLDSSATFQDGALHALSTICEQSPSRLGEDPSRPLDAIVPKLLYFLQHPAPSVRSVVVHILSQFLLQLPAALTPHLPAYRDALLNSAADPSPDVRRRVTAALRVLLDSQPAVLSGEAHLSALVSTMMMSSADRDASVALEACEFWSSIAPGVTPAVRPFLRRLLPILLDNMVYASDDIAAVDASVSADDAALPDRPEDVRPFFHHSHSHRGGSSGGGGVGTDHSPRKPGTSSTPPERGAGAGYDAADSGESDVDNDDIADDDDAFGEWNVRKCSAAGLDALAHKFGDELLPHLQPLLEERLTDNSRWLVRESAVLALGAIAQGCYKGMVPNLPHLVPFLTRLVADSYPLVRTIACWSLSRYARWLASRKEDALPAAASVLIARLTDSSKRVQQAACSSLAVLLEAAGPAMQPYLPALLPALTAAFDQYQARNRLGLYDATSTLAEYIGYPALADPSFSRALLAPLVVRWNMLVDFDMDLLPLFDCIARVVRALMDRAQPFSAPLFSRGVRVLNNVVVRASAGDSADGDEERVLCALDLLSAVVTALGPQAEPLVVVEPALIPLLVAIGDIAPAAGAARSNNAARHASSAACGVLGELARSRSPSLLRHAKLADVLAVLASATAGGDATAAWSLGEVCLMVVQADGASAADKAALLTPPLSGILPPLMAAIVARPAATFASGDEAVTAAVTLCRLSWALPDPVAPALCEVLPLVTAAVAAAEPGRERAEAVHGLCVAVGYSVADAPGVAAGMAGFCELAADFGMTPEEVDVVPVVATVLSSWKAATGAGWGSFVTALSTNVRAQLGDLYGL